MEQLKNYGIMDLEEKVIENNNFSNKKLQDTEEKLIEMGNKKINDFEEKLIDILIQGNKKMIDLEEKLIEIQQFDQVVENIQEYQVKLNNELKVDKKSLLYQSYKKLSENIEILENPDHIAFLVSTISEENLSKLKPKSLLKFNPKKDNISVEDFKNRLKGSTNCLFLVKVKKNKYSDFEFYGGFAPDSSIFTSSENLIGIETDQSEESNFPYTFDLNFKVKRNLIASSNKYWAYECKNDRYFQFFGGDLAVFGQSSGFAFYYALFKGINYKSQSEENIIQKRYDFQRMQEIEIEVVDLY